jgi:hypothetical protein
VYAGEDVNVRANHAYFENVGTLFSGDLPEEPAQEASQTSVNPRLTFLGRPDDVAIELVEHPSNLASLG